MKLFKILNWNYDRRPLPDPVVLGKTPKEAGEKFLKRLLKGSNYTVSSDEKTACFDLQDIQVYIEPLKEGDTVYLVLDEDGIFLQNLLSNNTCQNQN